MRFVRLEMLFLIWTIPVFFMVFLYGWKKRRRILLRYASQKGLDAIAPETLSARRAMKAALMLAALLFVIIALSGPQYGYRWQEVQQRGIDIIVALDCSRSMLATDIKPTRLDRAKREVYDLLALLKGDRIGLVAFAGTAFLQAPLTLDYEGFHIFLSALSPDFLPVGGTDISGAIETALSAFDEKTDSQKAIILITDGENTGKSDPVAAAKEAEAAGVKVFSIGVGRPDGVPIPGKAGGFQKDDRGTIVLSRLDEDTLKKIAALTGGTYVRSIVGDMDLDRIYTTEIRGKMELSTLTSGRKQIWEDRFQWFVALAIIACILEGLLPLTRKSATATLVLVCFLLLTFPAHAESYRESMQKGLSAYDRGDYESALTHFTAAQLEKPDDTGVSYNLGNTYYMIGDYDSAANHFKALEKTQDKALRRKVLYNLGNANFRKQMLDEAIENYQEALTVDPVDIQTQQNLAYVKKMSEMQKEQQKQQGDSNEDKDKKDPSDNDPSESGQGDSQEKDDPGTPDPSEQQGKDNADNSENQPQPSYGKEMDSDASSESTQPPADSEADENQAPPAGSTGTQPDEMTRSPDEKKQAERALNRLKDQPGKAMIPMVRGRHVEKDW
ncbi:MAG: VWA domain-containing protein [Desulfobacterales bacterium]